MEVINKKKSMASRVSSRLPVGELVWTAVFQHSRLLDAVHL